MIESLVLPGAQVETQLARLVQMLNLKVAPKPAKIPVVAPTAAEKAEKAAKRKSGASDDADAEVETKGKKLKAKGDRKDKVKGVKNDKVKKQKREQ